MISIINISSRFIRENFNNSLPKGITYHNLVHTLDVVKTSQEIARSYCLNFVDLEILLIASWFHDIGILKQYDNHEVKSARICSEFLKRQNYPVKRINKIAQIIRSTKIPQKPRNLLEKILCDADLSHIGKKNFSSRAQLLRIEWEKMIGKKYSDFDWLKTNILFIKKNKFHTKSAKLLFDTQRRKNLTKLQKETLNYKITPPPKHKSSS